MAVVDSRCCNGPLRHKRENLMNNKIWPWPYDLVRSGALVLLALGCLVASGCTFLAMAGQQAVGVPVPPRYVGLKKQSVAIVVYANQAVTFMYPQAAQEVSSFVSNEMQAKIPSIRLLPYMDVLAWQRHTPGWQALPVKSIGRHFGVNRVLYLELVHYRTHAPGARHLMQGRIEANVFVYNTQIPGSGLVFSTHLNTLFPQSGPEPVFDSDNNVVRMRTLELFSRDLTRMFYTWRTYGNHPHE